MHRRTAPLSLCALVLAVALLGAPLGLSPVGAASRPTATEVATRSTGTAKALATKFFDLLEHHDVAGLRRFLSPAFELQRADGSGATKAEYLADLPTVTSFTLSDFVATRSGNTLAARYLAAATGTVDGKPYTPGPAPRLSVFVLTGSGWQLIAHANFNPLTG